jgi:hypothetical protein
MTGYEYGYPARDISTASVEEVYGGSYEDYVALCHGNPNSFVSEFSEEDWMAMRSRTLKHPNGAPRYTDTGEDLDEEGNFSRPDLR